MPACPSSAREHFEAALKINPGLIAAHDNLAEYWLVRNRWDKTDSIRRPWATIRS